MSLRKECGASEGVLRIRWSLKPGVPYVNIIMVSRLQEGWRCSRTHDEIPFSRLLLVGSEVKVDENASSKTICIRASEHDVARADIAVQDPILF